MIFTQSIAQLNSIAIQFNAQSHFEPYFESVHVYNELFASFEHNI